MGAVAHNLGLFDFVWKKQKFLLLWMQRPEISNVFIIRFSQSDQQQLTVRTTNNLRQRWAGHQYLKSWNENKQEWAGDSVQPWLVLRKMAKFSTEVFAVLKLKILLRTLCEDDGFNCARVSAKNNVSSWHLGVPFSRIWARNARLERIPNGTFLLSFKNLCSVSISVSCDVFLNGLLCWWWVVFFHLSNYLSCLNVQFTA